MFHASLLTIAAGHQLFNCSAAVNQLMQEHHFSAFLHQFPDLHWRPGARPGRVQMKSDACPLVSPPHASTPFLGLMHEPLFFCSMHHFSALFFPKGKELTTDPRPWKVCRQSNVFFSFLFQSKFRSMAKNPFFQPEFSDSKALSCPHPRHWTLIYPAAAGKLTTERSSSRFRRQFLPVS